MKGKKKGKLPTKETYLFYTTNVQNYSIKPNDNQGKKHTILKIVAGDEIVSLFGNYIPYPNDHYSDKLYSNRLVYSWLIDGFFGTADGYKYLNDIIARFKLSCDSADLHSLKMVDDENQSTHKLKAFRGLKSLASERVKEKFARLSKLHDYVFWCLKVTAEDMIRQNGLIIYSTFEDFATSNFLDKCKDKSTLRAKCRNIYNWYFERDWKIGREKSNLSKEKLLATRQEHQKNMVENLMDKNRMIVQNAVSGLFSNSLFKKKNGTWNAVTISTHTGLDVRTVRKYLAELQN